MFQVCKWLLYPSQLFECAFLHIATKRISNAAVPANSGYNVFSDEGQTSLRTYSKSFLTCYSSFDMLGALLYRAKCVSICDISLDYVFCHHYVKFA